MDIHLIDGTYELFRYFYGAPSHVTDAGEEVAATRGVVASLLKMLEEGATHVGVATDSVVSSFRNELFDGYKTGDDMDPAVLGQFSLLEDALESFGFVVWPMVDHEADDGLASAAVTASADSRVSKVLICSPDKDLAQCVGGKVFQVDRRREITFDVGAVQEKFGVSPSSIPDYLALVGDSADGFPGLKGFGARTAATLLATYSTLEAIPASAEEWSPKVRGAAKLAETLRANREDADLFKVLATLIDDLELFTDVDELRWDGPRADCAAMASRLDAPRLATRATQLAAQ